MSRVRAGAVLLALALLCPLIVHADDTTLLRKPGAVHRHGSEDRMDDKARDRKAAKRKAFPVVAAAKVELLPFNNSPFPYRGMIPAKNKPFLDALGDDGRRGHTSGRGGIYWEDEVYSDRRSLIAFPHGFNLNKPAAIILFLHGNGATLARDVAARQQIPAQLDQSGLNAVLLAPQFAFDALDSSAGMFWTEGGFRRYLEEASTRLAEAYGDAAARPAFARLPVILVAYSGGYNPAAYALSVGGDSRRLIGLLLLDALYGEEDRFADWIGRNHKRAFVFSAYSKAAAASNEEVERQLTARRIRIGDEVPSRLVPGGVAFLAVDPSVNHDDFMISAWTDYPLRSLLARIPGFER